MSSLPLFNPQMSEKQTRIRELIKRIKDEKNYGRDYIEDFDFEPATTLKFQMWAATSSVECGMNEGDLLLVHGLTIADLKTYYQNNPQNLLPHLKNQ